jgi:hypothetical protein
MRLRKLGMNAIQRLSEVLRGLVAKKKKLHV